MHPRATKLLRKLAISIASLVVVLGGAELIARVFAPLPDYYRWMADAEVQIIPLPDQQTFFGKNKPDEGQHLIPIRINHYGQRGPDYPLQKPPGELRIMVLGDSLTMGQGVQDDESFPARLGQLMAAQDGEGHSVRVVNAGVNGWTSWHYMRWVETKLPAFDADVVVLALCLGNDMVPPGRGATAIPVPLDNLLRDSALYQLLVHLYRVNMWKRVEAARRDMTLSELEQQMDVYRGFADSELSEADQRLLWEVNALPHLRRLQDSCEAQGVRLVVLLLPTLGIASGESPVDLHEFLLGHLEQQGVAVLTCRQELHDAGREAWLDYDSGHLSVSGNQLVAEVLLRGLQGLGIAAQ